MAGAAAEMPGTAAARRVHIALLSPYTGGNLGDAAILEAAMQNFRAAHANVTFAAVTLNPERVRTLHGLPGTRAVAYGLTYYNKGDSPPEADGHRARAGSSRLARLKGLAARRLPRLYRFARRARSLVSSVGSEMIHFAHALRFLRDKDILVIAGGGQLDEEWGGAFGHPYALLKWTCAARLAGRPVAFMSVGVARLESRASRWFARHSLRLARLASLRDPWSQSFAADQLRIKGLPVRPDLAFGLPAARIERRPDGERLTIGVSPIAYGRHYVWPTLAQEVSERYLDVLRQFVERQAAAGHRVVLFHTEGADRSVALWLAERVNPVAAVQVAATGTLPQLLEVLPTLDVVVASRLHGIILSHLHAIPSLALSYDRKVATHMAQAGHAAYCLQLEDLRLDALEERFAAFCGERLARGRELAGLRERWKEQLAAEFRKTIDLVLTDASPVAMGAK